MSDTIPPLGTLEGLKIEFERADKLRNPDRRRDIVRAVVAMRNARGGSIWVGLTEVEGGLTGIDPSPLGPDDRRHVDSLRNQVIDLVEPMIELGRDVVLETVDVPGGWVLEVRVRRGDKATPHCVLSGRSREFLTRSGSRNAVLPYSSIVRDTRPDEPSIRATTADLHTKWSERFAKFPGLALTAVADPHRHRDSLPAKVSENALHLLESPPTDSIRRDGWTWFSKYSPVKRGQAGTVRTGKSYKDEPYRFLELQPNGTLQFFTTMGHLSWKESSQTAGVEFELPPKGQVYPYAIVETVASLIRTYSRLLGTPEYESLETVGLLLSFERAAGWIMCRTGPDAWFFANTRDDWFQVLEDPTRTPVRLQTGSMIRASPDLVSYELLNDLLQTDGGKQLSLPWFEGAPDAPVFVPPQ